DLLPALRVVCAVSRGRRGSAGGAQNALFAGLWLRGNLAVSYFRRPGGRTGVARSLLSLRPAAAGCSVTAELDAICATPRGRGGASGGDDDLPAGVAVSEIADRVRNLVERERPVHDRPDRPALEQLPQLFQVLAAL